MKNPDVDIDHYLHGSNPIFRKFIDDGLADLERAAAENNHADNKVLSENRFGITKPIGKDPDYWMERLNALKVGSGTILLTQNYAQIQLYFGQFRKIPVGLNRARTIDHQLRISTLICWPKKHSSHKKKLVTPRF